MLARGGVSANANAGDGNDFRTTARGARAAMSDRGDTIFALSSGRPPAAIAVVRVSGPAAKDAVVAVAGRLPAPRRAALMRLRRRAADGDRGEAIDEAVVLWFPGPRSETGEDTAEFQLHGGPAVVAAMLAALGAIDGLRPAEPGEFTRRAFENGKLDLTRVEGLADLIGAETEAQRRQALGQLEGRLSDCARQWRQRLTGALALVEAAIDFPDEGIDADGAVAPALAVAADLAAEIGHLLADAHRGERLRDGLTVAIAGAVNVGKSTLLNRLARRSAAIVSPQAGTTRDAIEVHLDLGGFPVTVVDTAGIRDTADPVEEEGVRRARARAAAADLVLWVVDGSAGGASPEPADLTKPGAPALWRVINKMDVVGGAATGREGDGQGGQADYRISAETGMAVDDLVAGIAAFAGALFAPGREAALVTRERQRRALTQYHEALQRAVAEGEGRGREDLIAEELRLAARALGRLVGKVDVEDVLDVIFRDFCIGK
jgi:tRNA modification GTPase